MDYGTVIHPTLDSFRAATTQHLFAYLHKLQILEEELRYRIRDEDEFTELAMDTLLSNTRIYIFQVTEILDARLA
jgi:hypothetical protein